METGYEEAENAANAEDYCFELLSDLASIDAPNTANVENIFDNYGIEVTEGISALMSASDSASDSVTSKELIECAACERSEIEYRIKSFHGE